MRYRASIIFQAADDEAALEQTRRLEADVELVVHLERSEGRLPALFSHETWTTIYDGTTTRPASPTKETPPCEPTEAPSSPPPPAPAR